MGTPAIDYTDKDYASLRAALLRLAAQRLPEWTDRSPSDLIMVFIDLFAYCGDIVAYYQDRIASELFPSTATERAGLVDLLRLIGYEFALSTPARADLRLSFRAPVAPADPDRVTVATGTRFRAQVAAEGAIEFRYLGPDLALDLRSSQVRADPFAPLVHYDRLPVTQGRVVAPVVIGSGGDVPDQMVALPDREIDLDSVRVEVNEGAGWVLWERTAAAARTPDSVAREYRLVVDATETPQVVFGARRPPVALNNIRAGYRVCVGARGNVAAGAITEAVAPITALATVTNPDPAAGGSDAESVQSAIRTAPELFRSMQRAVTAADYAALARRAGAVAKVRVHSRSWNRVDLYVAPAGDRLTPLPDSLRDHLIAYFEDKRSATTLVSVFGARPAPIDITVSVVVDKRAAPSTVPAAVGSAVARLLSFADRDFGQTIYLSEVYAVVESVPGVLGATVDRFRRADRPAPDVEAALAAAGLPALEGLPVFVRDAVSADIAPGGRVEAGEFEIPVLGTLDIREARP
ncbi:baseplate J/gp47 family protein [Nocardia goodfellowii]|uniref:Phage protein gp47/JayE n=1 Tax=Nocardia goodfellowii TaxID=882446 RepID=A0ABS4QMN5_9NOCA|nr:baseplate J/gp47 family protein [Nocardia goodfellowii]MBP2192962.1 putative phage protein gp47/JayE [Nocardia goodfellowii]